MKNMDIYQKDEGETLLFLSKKLDRLDQRFDELENKLDTGFLGVNERLDRIEQKLERFKG
ncbi:hypothetical protein OCO53_03425 [Peribacillus frigoritolerans]|uniref:hypothetical protein n=1 Tax=Peribacillus frigoritolerans TaxID=450367 RepID=UPI0021D0C310|nr:hypothetical protein [Peribacillus frigoritolerans]MCU6599516.1 hypothetical protein [Peribacillus frigoritolerans]